MDKNEIIELLKKDILSCKRNDNIDDVDYAISTLNTLKEAINYTRCCEELKVLDSDNFEDWLIVNGYTVYKDHYMKGDQVFFESELMQKYNNEVMNL